MATTDQPGSALTARSPALKIILIVLLTVAMAVPLFFIQMALSDRESTAQDAVHDIATGWGGGQTTAGPVLFVPYTVFSGVIIDGKKVQQTQYLTAVLLPNDLHVAVDTSVGERRRGIFKVPVYKATIDMHAGFDRDALNALVPSGGTALWDRASVSIIVSDAHGLADNVSLSLNGRNIAFQPGIGQPGPAGIHAPLGLTGAPGDLTLDTRVMLRGSREFSLSPLGTRTTATIHSNWTSPSFFGAFLPTERNISAEGFSASWTVPYLARGFGQSFSTPEAALQSVASQTFGVKFYQPVDHYQLVQRSLKYAVLFVALAFLIFFVVETVSTGPLHAVHYTLVGAAQVLFYLLLLSLAEHVGFAPAYLLAAGPTVVLTGLYAWSALANRLRAAVLTAVLGTLYGLLYVILNAEDYALLIGSAVLFVALASTMYATRRIDWSRFGGS